MHASLPVIPVLIGLGALAITILAHTAALFYWGGATARLLKTHDEEIKDLREWRNDEVSPTVGRVAVLETRIEALERPSA